MQIRIVPYSQADESAAQDFNRRLRDGGEIEFQLPEHMPPETPPSAAVRSANYLAFEDGVVRGGFLLASFPASFANGEAANVINCREPLSEGTVDSRYSLLALRLLKHIQQRGKLMFALGMGSEQARFTRLLKGAGWTIEPVPFLFKVMNARRFFLNIQQLRSGIRRTAAVVAAHSGIGKLGLTAVQARGITAAFRSSPYHIERVSSWGSWADTLWRNFQPACSFCVKRDRATLAEIYKLGQDRSEVFLVSRGGQPVGWVATQNSKFTAHKYFGAMQVATILDCIALPDAVEAVLSKACSALASAGVDLIVTNQSFEPYVKAFRNAGFLKGRSNYILATSKDLTAAIEAQSGGRTRIHFTRGDSDGRDHL